MDQDEYFNDFEARSFWCNFPDIDNDKVRSPRSLPIELYITLKRPLFNHCMPLNNTLKHPIVQHANHDGDECDK